MINTPSLSHFSSVWDSLCGPFLWSSGWIMRFAVILLQFQSVLVFTSVHLDEVLPCFVFTVIIINTVILKTHKSLQMLLFIMLHIFTIWMKRSFRLQWIQAILWDDDTRCVRNNVNNVHVCIRLIKVNTNKVIKLLFHWNTAERCTLTNWSFVRYHIYCHLV